MRIRAVSPTSTNANTNIFYYVGNLGTIMHNDYFSFYMDQVTVINAPIVSAYLSIPTAGTSGSGFPLTYYIGSVSIDAATLNNGAAGPSATIYNDLANGTPYGQISLNSSADYTSQL